MATAAALPARDFARSDVRERWRMSFEARSLTLVSFCILMFGLAVLYSASAIMAVKAGQSGAFYLIRQMSGAAVGVVAFAVAAKMDAERWREWAWPLMWFTLV